MYPSGFDYMAPPPPYPGPPQNWAAPPQNWTAPPPQPPPGLFLSLSLFHALPIFFFSSSVPLHLSDRICLPQHESLQSLPLKKKIEKNRKKGVLMSRSLQIKMSRNKTVFSPSCCCFSSNFSDFRLKTVCVSSPCANRFF